MIGILTDKFKKYDLRYDAISKVIIIKKPIAVRDFVTLKEIIKDFEMDIRNIRVIGR